MSKITELLKLLAADGRLLARAQRSPCSHKVCDRGDRRGARASGDRCLWLAGGRPLARALGVRYA